MWHRVLKLTRLTLALFVLLSISTAIIHRASESFDSSHHESSCEICIALAGLGNGIVPTLPLLVLPILLTIYFQRTIQLKNPFLKSTKYLFCSDVDPPFSSLANS